MATNSVIVISDGCSLNNAEYVERVSDSIIIRDPAGETLILQDYNPANSPIIPPTPPYVAENVANKRTNLLNPNNTTYPTTLAVSIAISGSTSGLTSDWNTLTSRPIWLTGQTLQAFQTGHTHPSLLNGYWTSGQTSIVIAQATSGLTSDWNTLTSRPIWLTGETLQAFQTGHTHIIGYDTIINKPILLLVSTFSGYTGTTVPNTYYNKTQINSYTGTTYIQITGITMTLADKAPLVHYHNQYLTGVTWGIISSIPQWVGSGSTIVNLVGSDYRIYTPVHVNDTWAQVTAKPSWLSGTTLSNFQLGHTHSQYLTGQTPTTWANVTSKPAWLSGSTQVLFQAQHTHAYISGLTSAAQTQLNTKATILANMVTVTGTTDTIADSDSGTIIKYTNDLAKTITLPTGLTTNMEFVAINYGAAELGFVAGAGATIHSNNSKVSLATIYAGATAIYEGDNTWYLVGNLT